MWTCPKCGSKVDPSFNVCWNCGTSAQGVEDPNFVPADQAGPIDDPRYDPTAEPTEPGAPIAGEVVACYQAFSLIEAKFLADQLNEAGIAAMADARDMQDEFGTMEGNPRIYCREADLAAARAWLEAYEQRKKAEGGPKLEP
ncbi:MAG: DUF2007 domain-containing protein [Isosphaeraceae bacterium]